jgi:hypothetical protein
MSWNWALTATLWRWIDFVALDPLFFSLLEVTNTNPKSSIGIMILLENHLPIFHEGPVLLEDALFFTSNRLRNTALGFHGAHRSARPVRTYLPIGSRHQ